MTIYEDDRTVSRADLAAWLRQLADQLDSDGQIFYGAAGRLTVADQVRCELEIERESGSEISVEIEFSWTSPEATTSDDEDDEEADEDDEDGEADEDGEHGEADEDGEDGEAEEVGDGPDGEEAEPTATAPEGGSAAATVTGEPSAEPEPGAEQGKEA